MCGVAHRDRRGSTRLGVIGADGGLRAGRRARRSSRKIPLVVDVAGVAVGAFGASWSSEPITDLGDAAARAEQVPAQLETDRLRAASRQQLDHGFPRRNLCQSRARLQGPDAAERSTSWALKRSSQSSRCRRGRGHESVDSISSADQGFAALGGGGRRMSAGAMGDSRRLNPSRPGRKSIGGFEKSASKLL